MAFLHPQAPTLASDVLLAWIWEKMVDKVVGATYAGRMNAANMQA